MINLINFEELHTGSILRNMTGTYWLALKQTENRGTYLWIREENKKDVIYNITVFNKTSFESAFLNRNTYLGSDTDRKTIIKLLLSLYAHKFVAK
jgi:hypothetical protein